MAAREDELVRGRSAGARNCRYLQAAENRDTDRHPRCPDGRFCRGSHQAAAVDCFCPWSGRRGTAPWTHSCPVGRVSDASRCEGSTSWLAPSNCDEYFDCPLGWPPACRLARMVCKQGVKLLLISGSQSPVRFAAISNKNNGLHQTTNLGGQRFESFRARQFVGLIHTMFQRPIFAGAKEFLLAILDANCQKRCRRWRRSASSRDAASMQSSANCEVNLGLYARGLLEF